jgi:hypothetical protein
MGTLSTGLPPNELLDRQAAQGNPAQPTASAQAPNLPPPLPPPNEAR